MSLLRIPDQPDVGWARFGRFGEGGTFGYQIDASGLELRNRMMHQDLLPATADVSLQTRIRMKSTLVTNNPSFEGLSVRHRGFQLQGSAPGEGDLQVWDSQPETQGTRAWISGRYGEFTTFNFVNEIPANLGIDYVTWEVQVRAVSGQVWLDDVQCRYYYGKLLPISITGTQRWETAAFIPQVMESNFSGETITRWLKYLRTEIISARRGQNLVWTTKCALNGIGYQFDTGVSIAQEPAATTRGFIAKLRRKGTSIYDYVEIVSNYTAANSYRPTVINDARAVIARHDYDQMELAAFIEPHPEDGYDTFGPFFVEYKDVNTDLVIADFVADSQ